MNAQYWAKYVVHKLDERHLKAGNACIGSFTISEKKTSSLNLKCLSLNNVESMK